MKASLLKYNEFKRVLNEAKPKGKNKRSKNNNKKNPVTSLEKNASNSLDH